MGMRLATLTLLAFVVSAMAGPLVYAGDPTMIGWWKLDEGAGSTVSDLSGRGNHGTVLNPNGGMGTGGSVWFADPERGMVLSFNGTDGSGACVDTDLLLPAMTLSNGFTWAFWAKQHANQATNNDTILGNRYGGTSSPLQFIKFTPTRFECYNDDGSYVNGINYNSIPNGVWVHHVLVKDGASLTYYRDGVSTLTNKMTKTVDRNPFYMGADAFSGVAENWQGYLSDVRLYERALTAGEVLGVMAGKGPGAALAGNPVPEDKATDVSQDAIVTWTPGEFAATHDVYFGTSFADVNDASRADSKGVLAGQDQATAEFDPDGLLEFGETYYWRVDEVNAAPDNTVFKGDVWSLTAEPFAYAITAGIAATASSAQPNMGPQNAVDGSGLDADGQHSTEPTHMWMTNGAKPAWIQFEFSKVYKLQEMWVWNSNQLIEGFIGFGAKNVTIEYSTDGATWATLEGVPEFAKAPGAPAYATNTTVPFGGVLARFVKLTIDANWGGAAPQTGLAEVRFFQIPVQAREPMPADGATGVSLETQMDWRPGREATSHQVLFGTDEAAVADGTAAAQTVTGHSYAPAAMEFGTEYFWKVDEVGDAGTYEGELWNFTTQEFAAIDDFEAYNDDDNRIYDSWIDGVTTGASGSTVGYMQAPFAEKTIIHGGKQSLPLAYDNGAAPFFSEAEREFETAQNWTGSGATELCVWTHGYPAPTAVAVTETSGKMALTGAGADIWNNSDEFTYAYKTLTGDGALIARVTSNGTGSNTWAKGGVMIRDSLNGGSTHAMMVMTGSGGNGASFQYRATANGASAGVDSSSVLAPPYWVKIERQGDILTGHASADGKTWTLMGQTTITMEAPIYIGVCVTSHAAGEDRTFQFDGISASGGVGGAWQGVVIASPQYNDAADMYLVITDSAGKTARASSATAVNAADWTRWIIPMSDLAGVNVGKVKKLTIGVGNTAAGGKGMVFIDDIGYGRSAQ